MIDNPQLPQLQAVIVVFANERFRFGQIAVPVFSWLNVLNLESSGNAQTCPGIMLRPVLESCLDLSQNHAWTCPGTMPGPVLESCSCDIHVGEGASREGVRFCWLCVQ